MKFYPIPFYPSLIVLNGDAILAKWKGGVRGLAGGAGFSEVGNGKRENAKTENGKIAIELQSFISFLDQIEEGKLLF